MFPQNMGQTPLSARHPDVAESQPLNLVATPCQRWRQSATVCKGRTQAAFASDERCAIGCPDATFQEYRRRGCRRARKLSWRCVLWPLLLPAHPSSLKSFMWTNRFRLSQSTPANTNNPVGRAAGKSPVRPAQSITRPRGQCHGAPRSVLLRTSLRQPSTTGAFLQHSLIAPRLFPAAPLGVLPACAYGCAHPSTGGTSC